MARNALSSTARNSACLLITACFSTLLSAQTDIQDEDDGAAGHMRRGRFAAAAGFDIWNDINELHPRAGGRFDSGGFVLDFAAHWRMKQWDTSNLLFGLDVGVFSHDSNVYHIREDLTARGFYLTPSVKWQLGWRGGPRYSLDAGLGYYIVDIAEVDLSGYYGYYCCYSEEQLWEDSTLGGYIGTTVDFGRAARREGGGFTMGAKIHWADLGTVRDEHRFPPTGTLGPNAGQLSGPIVSMQFGYAF